MFCTSLRGPWTKKFGDPCHKRIVSFKCTCQARLTECSQIGKVNLPENAVSAKQCLAHAKWFLSLLLSLNSSFNSKKFEGFFNISGRLAAARLNLTAKNIVSGPLVQPQRSAQKLDH